jgi:peptidoglycan/xylan/chitin deacetylase (PgdA/CDA1 family)
MQNGVATFRRWASALLVAGQIWPATDTGVRAAEPVADNGAVVVMYHRFGEVGHTATNIKLDQFENHIEELASGRYNVLPLPEIVAALAEGRSLPERSLAITIDDAFLSVYTQAWPRLRAAGLPFTLFVATEPVERNYPGYMNWSQLRRMLAGGGVTIAAHGVTHGSMVGRSLEYARREIARGRAEIRARLDVTPGLFAYPFGEYGRDLRDLVADLGFTAAFGQHSGAIARTSDRYALPRFPFNESYGDLERFRLVANSLPIPAVDITPSDPLLSAANNPPPYGFTLLEGFGSPERIACYAVGQTLRVEQLGSRRIEVRLSEAFRPGRNRINCTLPGPGGRWRWLGRQFYVPSPQ